MSNSRRLCEVRIPDYLIERMEESAVGITATLSRVEREFGLTITWSFRGKKVYTIVGPNQDILELAMETLQRRLFFQDDNASVVSGEIQCRRAVWKFLGDNATKAGHLFKAELDQLRKNTSVHVSICPVKLEISCGYDRVEEVREQVEKMEEQLENLHERHIELMGTHAELVKLRQFVQRRNKYDYTVVCMLKEQSKRVTVYGRTEEAVQKTVDEWAMCSKGQIQTTSPALPYNIGNDYRYKIDMRVPSSVVLKLEKEHCGMDYIILSLEREYGLKVRYARKKGMTLYGPNLAILELAVQTLILRYVIRTPPESGILSFLRGKNAVWRFLGTYAKRIVSLFPKELDKIQRTRTVSMQVHPSKISPNILEILCSIRHVETVKTEVEKLVGLVHNLYVKELSLPEDHDQIAKVKELMQEHNETEEVLCLLNPSGRSVSVYGRNELVVYQVVTNLREGQRRAAKDQDTPSDCWNMFRQLYQTRVPDNIVQKLDLTPSGIMAVVYKIEKEYNVRTIFSKNRHMILVSPSVAMLELVLDTLEERYNGEDLPKEVERKKEKQSGKGEKNQGQKNSDSVGIEHENADDISSVKECGDAYDNQSLHNSVNNDDVVPEASTKEKDDTAFENKTVNDSFHYDRPAVVEIRNKHSLTLKRYPNNAISRFPEKHKPKQNAKRGRFSDSQPLKLSSDTCSEKRKSNLKRVDLDRAKSKDSKERPKTVTFEE